MTKISEQYSSKIRKSLLDSAEVKNKTADKCLQSILDAVQLIVDTFDNGGKVLICGNGGSAADSQHMACELVAVLNKTFYRPGLPAIALTTNTSTLTAYANDFGFDSIFERQVQALGKPGDLLIGISTSGNSKNVITAFEKAKSLEIKTLALTGEKGASLTQAENVISIPSSNTQYIQESHISIIHIICELVEQHFFGSKQQK